MPNFGAIDVIGVQWFLFSILNTIILIYVYFNRDLSLTPFNFKPYLLYAFFVITAVFSILYSKNSVISLFDSFKIINTFVFVFILIKLTAPFSFYQIFKFVSYIVVFLLVLDLFFTLSPFYFLFSDSYYFNSSDFSPEKFIGLYANKNITSALICIKLPFLFYLISQTNLKTNLVRLLFFYFLFFLVSLSVLFLSTRSVFLSFSFIAVFFILFMFIKEIKFNSFVHATIVIACLSISYSYNTYLLADENFNITDRVQSIEFSEESSNFRFYLWQNAIDYIKSNPLVGCGIGNWKIESLPYWRFKLSDYTVPYHAHNDFLELTTELGLIGGILYITVFLSILYLLFKTFYKLRIFSSESFILISLLIVYCTDAFFNFPLERASMQIFFGLLLVLCHSFYTSLQYEKK